MAEEQPRMAKEERRKAEEQGMKSKQLLDSSRRRVEERAKPVLQQRVQAQPQATEGLFDEREEPATVQSDAQMTAREETPVRSADSGFLLEDLKMPSLSEDEVALQLTPADWFGSELVEFEGDKREPPPDRRSTPWSCLDDQAVPAHEAVERRMRLAEEQSALFKEGLRKLELERKQLVDSLRIMQEEDERMKPNEKGKKRRKGLKRKCDEKKVKRLRPAAEEHRKCESFNERTDEQLTQQCMNAELNIDCQEPQFRETLLIAASKRNLTECVQSLLLKSASVSAQDASGRTALIWASIGGHVEVIRIMQGSHSAEEVNRVDNGQMTAAMHAACNGRTAAIEQLHLMGADFNMQDISDYTALIYAARFGFPDAVAKLLDFGSDPRLTDVFGNSALIWAARRGHADVIKEIDTASVLLPEDWLTKGECGRTAEQWAEYCGHDRCAQLIRECIKKQPGNLTTDPITTFPPEDPRDPNQPSGGAPGSSGGGGTESTPGGAASGSGGDLGGGPPGPGAPRNPGPQSGVQYAMMPDTSIAIVVNIVHFTDSRLNRDGAMDDTNRAMCVALSRLGFSVPRILINLDESELLTLKSQFPDDKYMACKMFLLCVMSHGELDYIMTSNGTLVSLEAVFCQFRMCPLLQDKPKLFIVQACRVIPAAGRLIPARNEQPNAGRHQDTIALFSVVPGDPSHRSCLFGGIFVQALKGAITNAPDLDGTEFTCLMPKVTSKVFDDTNGEQVACFTSTLRKQLYFPL